MKYLLCAVLLLTQPVLASELAISHAWARATPPGGQMGAVYGEISNLSNEPVEVLKVETSVAQISEVHDMFATGF